MSKRGGWNGNEASQEERQGDLGKSHQLPESLKECGCDLIHGCAALRGNFPLDGYRCKRYGYLANAGES